MAPVALLTPPRRDALLAVIALALLVAPVWAPILHLGDTNYRYERVRVTAENGTIEYANESAAPAGTPVSVEVACTEGAMRSRACFFEQYLANNTVPTSIYATNLINHDLPTFERYRYVVVNETVHELRYDSNRSHENENGMYRVDLALEPTSARDALKSVSIRAERAPGPVRAAAKRGTATSHRDLDGPKTPIRLSDGTYYRVYLSSATTSSFRSFAAGVLRWVTPLVGLSLIAGLSGRFEVRYVGK
ncbi:hypothetical protein [Halorussus pelagicus]|uniref:hypothetical protein n=1 Tax=Halorussus pelagicus TaxID=2505977 RepID=UPI000FFBAF25|nr:hypothetical protein [Halorussus pelagicus]